MARSLVSLITWIRDISLPSSNIPLVVSLTKMTLIIDPLPIRISKDIFVITKDNKGRRLAAILVLLLHLAVVLKWVFDQWFAPVNRTAPIWKFVYIYYCMTLFSAVVVFIAHITLQNGETVSLLNTALQLERDSKSNGEYYK